MVVKDNTVLLQVHDIKTLESSAKIFEGVEKLVIASDITGFDAKVFSEFPDVEHIVFNNQEYNNYDDTFFNLTKLKTVECRGLVFDVSKTFPDYKAKWITPYEIPSSSIIGLLSLSPIIDGEKSRTEFRLKHESYNKLPHDYLNEYSHRVFLDKDGNQYYVESINSVKNTITIGGVTYGVGCEKGFDYLFENFTYSTYADNYYRKQAKIIEERWPSMYFGEFTAEEI